MKLSNHGGLEAIWPKLVPSGSTPFSAPVPVAHVSKSPGLTVKLMLPVSPPAIKPGSEIGSATVVKTKVSGVQVVPTELVKAVRTK